ncbi:MAG: hypothetical protein ACQERD_01940 [Campylobacterota bacterium]
MIKSHSMKNAFVEQIILWIVIFVSFVGFLFFVIDYSNSLKVKENADSIAQYTSRMVAINKPLVSVAQGINEIKGDFVKTVSVGDLNCSENTAVTNRQVIVNVYATLNNSFLTNNSNNIHSKSVVYNESSEYEKECNLTLTFN